MMHEGWILFGEITGAVLLALGIVAFAYVTWRLAVTRAAKETIELLTSQVQVQAQKIGSLEDERHQDKERIATLEAQVAALRELVTHAAEVGKLREEVHEGHAHILLAIEGLRHEGV